MTPELAVWTCIPRRHRASRIGRLTAAGLRRLLRWFCLTRDASAPRPTLSDSAVALARLYTSLTRAGLTLGRPAHAP